MIIYNTPIDNKIDYFGRRPQVDGYRFKTIHCGLFKICKAYVLYHLPPVKNEFAEIEGVYGTYLAHVEIKWGWK